MKNTTHKHYTMKGLNVIVLVLSLFTAGCEDLEESLVIPQVIPDLTVFTSVATAITTTSARCGGVIESITGQPILSKGVCWSTSPHPGLNDDNAEDRIASDSISVVLRDLSVYTTYYVRPYVTTNVNTIFGEETTFTTQGGTVTDIDGNVYHTISIGSQVWLAENLQTTRYRNGDSIALVANGNRWATLPTLPDPGAFCYYNNDPAKAKVYGALYNWYAIGSQRNIAPVGWHVPSKSEWITLISSGNIKEPGTTHWAYPNAEAVYDNGFSALPGGSRDLTGHFSGIRERAFFWTSTPGDDPCPDAAQLIELSYLVGYYADGVIESQYGFSVRCVRD